MHLPWGKERPLRHLLVELWYPILVLLHETGFLHATYIFHGLYWVIFSLDVAVSSLGVAILLRRNPNIRADIYWHPQHGGLVVDFESHGVSVCAVTAYLPVRGRAVEHRCSLD